MQRNGWIKYFSFAALLGLILLSAPAHLQASRESDLPPGDTPPPDLFSRLERAGTAEDHDGAASVIVYDYSRNSVKPSGVTYVDKYLIYKVLSSAGCRNRSVLNWKYDPRSSHVEVREVNIVRDGKRIPVDVSRVRDLPAPQSMIYWKDRVKTLQLPRLRINDGIEIRTFRKGFTYALLGHAENEAPAGAGSDTASTVEGDEKYIPPMPGEYFDIVLFSASKPVIEKKYVLSLPPDKRLHSEIYNGPLYSSTTYNDDCTEYAWWGLNLPSRTHEPAQPAPSDYAPKVVMATVKDWETKSRWFFDVNRGQFDVTGAIREKVDEIFRKADIEDASEERKAKALLHWVAQNIRYSGQTMGEGEGFTLHPGSMIFDQRSGVCKDIAGMLITMMRAAGMDSYAAMTMAGSRIEKVPADQFNHCVCALRGEDGSFEMYDPTWVPFNNDIWSLLEAEQDYLIGTPGGETLDRIAYSPPEESPLKIVHNAKLRRDGSLEGTFELSGSGALDSRLRRIISGSRKSELDLTVAGLIVPISSRVERIEYEFLKPDDFSSDMWVKIDYRIPRFALRVAGGYEFKSPLMKVVLNNARLFRAASVNLDERRETDLFLYYTQLIDGTERIRMPRGYETADLPSSEEIDRTYAYFKGSSREDGADLVINHRAEIRRRQIPPDGYGGFREALEEAKLWGEEIFRIEKGGN
ncbi:MAG: DUF3857 domain-containing protein [Candidatus Krumholzibacteriota bacterium]|nr:DUF3857 domain-containing protein [Candidatus Krumholzibacteriota bacterium]